MVGGFRRDIAIVKMNMTVQVVSRFERPQKPLDRGESPMGEIGLVVDIPRWGVADQHVEPATMANPVPGHFRDHSPDFRVHLAFGELLTPFTRIAR